MAGHREDVRDKEYAVRMSHYVEPILPYLTDRSVTEIYTNPATGEVWLATNRGRQATGKVLTEMAIRAFLNVVAERQKETLGRDNEHIQAQLPRHIFGGARLQGVTPRIVEKPCFNLRKRASVVYPLADYVKSGTMTLNQEQRIREAIIRKENILVFGGTGSGKTTLVNAIIDGMVEEYPDEDFLILEDTQELQCTAPGARYMTQTIETSLQDLVYISLRMFPDRIIIGEVRDEAALVLMDAWRTGHSGTGTVHAETPLAALRRMDRLARRASDTDYYELVAEAINVLVGIERGPKGRIVKYVAEVDPALDDNGRFVIREVPRTLAGVHHEGRAQAALAASAPVNGEAVPSARRSPV